MLQGRPIFAIYRHVSTPSIREGLIDARRFPIYYHHHSAPPRQSYAPLGDYFTMPRQFYLVGLVASIASLVGAIWQGLLDDSRQNAKTPRRAEMPSLSMMRAPAAADDCARRRPPRRVRPSLHYRDTAYDVPIHHGRSIDTTIFDFRAGGAGCRDDYISSIEDCRLACRQFRRDFRIIAVYFDFSRQLALSYRAPVRERRRRRPVIDAAALLKHSARECQPALIRRPAASSARRSSGQLDRFCALDSRGAAPPLERVFRRENASLMMLRDRQRRRFSRRALSRVRRSTST